MNLLDVELAHEFNGLRIDDLSRTMIGNPGGYGMTKFAETNSGPSFRRLSISGLDSFMCSHCFSR